MSKSNEHVPNALTHLLYLIKTDPSELFRMFRVGLITAKFRYFKRCVGKGTVVGPNTEIINSANVHVGQGCLIQDAVYIRAGVQGRVTIGDRAAINSFCRMFGHGSIEVGEDTQIGPGSLITTTDHDYSQDMQTSFKPVVIGKRVWVGANVTILPGIKIGDFAVIGAGSVVTKDVPAHCVAVGVPARVIKKHDRSPDKVPPERMEIAA